MMGAPYSQEGLFKFAQTGRFYRNSLIGLMNGSGIAQHLFL